MGLAGMAAPVEFVHVPKSSMALAFCTVTHCCTGVPLMIWVCSSFFASDT